MNADLHPEDAADAIIAALGPREWPETVIRTWMTSKEVRESGLLAYLNRTVLWPLGLALAVHYDKDTETYLEESNLQIQRIDPFDVIIGDGDESAEEREANQRRFADWLAARVAR